MMSSASSHHFSGATTLFLESEPNSPTGEAAHMALTSTHATYHEIHVDQVSEVLPTLENGAPMLSGDAEPTAGTVEHRLQTLPLNTASMLIQHQTPMAPRSEDEDLKQEQPRGTATPSTATVVQATDQENLNVLVYDIASLLELGKGPCTIPKEMGRCDSDTKENVFKDFLKEDNTRLRGLSNTSTVASESMEAEEQIVFLGQAQRSQRQAIRQPYGPPQSSLAQQHAGFARFLREHASPPHHRVTAGGRIVPNGPLSPPPMFRLDTIDSIVQSQNFSAPAQSPQLPQPVVTSAFDAAQTAQSNSASADSTDPKPGPSNASSEQQGYAALSGRAMNSIEGPAVGSSGQRQASIGRPMPGNVGGVLQIPPGAVPTMTLEGGGMIVAYQGIMLRATLDQANNTMLEPVQVVCQAPEIQQPVAIYPQANPYFTGPLGFQPVTMLPSPSALASSMPLANSTNGAHLFQHHQLQTEAQLQALTNHYDDLHSQLEALDRHVALYRHLLPPTVNASMVAQRIQLVQQLDSIRVNIRDKEQLERSISEILHMPQGSQATFEQYGRQTFQTAAGAQSHTPMLNVGHHMMGAAAPVTSDLPHGRLSHETNSSSKTLSKSGATQNGSKSSTYLSPDAPAFVPNNTSASAFRTVGETQGKGDEQKHPKTATHQAAHSALTKIPCPAGDNLSVVIQDDIDYVDRLALNEHPGPKLFCSTIEEFQEVIRRAREQARLYGCAGGQSKDPEYDAEQDIRWAMTSSDAIPLPTTIPDHVSNPRPWKWGDSPFNIYADQGYFFANMGRLKFGYKGMPPIDTSTWGQEDSDDNLAATTLTRKDSLDSLPGNARRDLAPFDYSNWGKLPCPPDVGSAGGCTSVWAKVPPTQAENSGGNPPAVSTTDANHQDFCTMAHGNTSEAGSDDGWYTPGRARLWPIRCNPQDWFVKGWPTTPPSTFTAITPDETWGPKSPYPHQSKVSHPATENTSQYSQASGMTKEPFEEPTGSRTYAKKTTFSSDDVSKLQTSQPLPSVKAVEGSNQKPYQAYVEDAVDSPTGIVSYWDIVAKEIASGSRKKKTWYKHNDKDDDDSSSVDSWRTTSPERESYQKILQRAEFIKSSLTTDALPGKTVGLEQSKVFDPSELKAVRIPSPAKNTEANPFYLNMLKDSRYSATTVVSDGVVHGSVGSGELAKKENQNAQIQANAAVGGEDKTKQGLPSSIAPNAGMWQNYQVHKAPSSIATQVYEVHGYLPPYSAANSLNGGDSAVSPHRRPPSCALLGGGVSIEGLPVGRMDRFPTGDYDTGSQFFSTVREQEREDMATHKPLNPPNWQA